MAALLKLIGRIRGGQFLTKAALTAIAEKLEELDGRVDALENPQQG